MTKTKSICLALIAVLLSPMAANADPIVTADVVYVDSAGRQWVEINETVGSSWNDVASVCNPVTGECSGILDNRWLSGDLDMTGLVWATVEQVTELIYEITGIPPGSLDSGSATFPHASGYGILFSQVFTATVTLQSHLYDGYTRDAGGCPFVGQPLVSVGRHGTFDPPPHPGDSKFDVARCGSIDMREIFGGWYYYAPVPEPGTLALLGLGLAGMGMARRRTLLR